MAQNIKALVILSGCGVFDGSEIQEAVCTLIHLNRSKHVEVTIAAPDIPQQKVVNHLTGKESMEESRNVLIESARIARGGIRALHTLHGADYDAIIFPGGFGAALNLCTFAIEGPKCRVDPDVARVVREAHEAHKVIGLMCIAPAIAAVVLGGEFHPSLTIGNDDKQTAQAIIATGAQHIPTEDTGVCVDEKNRIVTTPAYMCSSASPASIYEGVGHLITKVLELACS